MAHCEPLASSQYSIICCRPLLPCLFSLVSFFFFHFHFPQSKVLKAVCLFFTIPCIFCSSSEMRSKRWHIVSALVYWYSLSFFAPFFLSFPLLIHPYPSLSIFLSPRMNCVSAAFQRCETKGGILSQH